MESKGINMIPETKTKCSKKAFEEEGNV